MLQLAGAEGKPEVVLDMTCLQICPLLRMEVTGHVSSEHKPALQLQVMI